MGDKKLVYSSFAPMDLDSSKAHEMDFCNLVNVPVGQIQQQAPVPKSQRSFVRIVRSKIVESKNNLDKQVAFCEPQSDKANLKRKTIIDAEVSDLDPGVEQGVGLTQLSTSATALHTGDDRVRRQTRGMALEVHSWQYSRDEGRCYLVEDVLVKHRRWLKDGLGVAVTICFAGGRVGSGRGVHVDMSIV
ncbi:tetratricopeptide repeat protein [Striga asiatica]|uniref:Tetratricopeptide repeat protein n=1 Tax=Striga asiatica TaxID=4170 RepID=A0A5A7R154_STRAF|nr:tetratricopeptide repeat protein [Striga asiatica]